MRTLPDGTPDGTLHDQDRGAASPTSAAHLNLAASPTSAGVSRRRLMALAASAASVTAAGMVAAPGVATAAAGRATPDRSGQDHGVPGHEPDFGPNVFVYDPSTPVSQIQARFDDLFAQQASNEMGTARYAVLFKPGTYTVNANLGYYTTVAGLGRSPDDVDIHGAVRVVGQPDPTSAAGISALINFWRSAENLSVTPDGGLDQWAVSQASPLRRVHIRGMLLLEPGNGGFSSGGYIADSKVDGLVINGSQQQWLTRDSEFGNGWSNGVWNQVFSGVTGAPDESFPNPTYTTLATSPVSREKPFLYLDSSGRYRVFLPALRRDSAGTTWSAGPASGSSLSIDDFYIAKPTDSALKINLALALGRHLLLTPGVYHLEAPLLVTHRNTVVLGLGMPSLTPDRGTAALRVADVDGVRIAGVLIDAGPRISDTLVEIGTGFARRSHAHNPISVQDVFFRIGGPWLGRAKTSLVVNSDDTIIDNIWVWRADHGNGVGWTQNTSDTGAVINGDNVTAYGLFVEHHQKYQTVWNGEHGRTIFYQSEMPYDPPSQRAWSSPTGNGWASYKVGPKVRTHEAWGLGVYCFFNQGVDIRADRAIEVPRRSGVRFHNMISVFLSGSGGIEHTINEAGTATVGSFGTSTVVSYP